jgi:hypothetical protein
MSRRRRLAVLWLGLAALAVVGAFSPRIYRRVRSEILLARLERGDDPSARRELADLRCLERAGERLRATRNESLARNLVELARDGRLAGPTRRDAFDLVYPVSFVPGPAKRTMEASGRPRDQLIVTNTKSSMSAVTAIGPWQKHTLVVSEPLDQYTEYFVAGEGDEARLVYQRLAIAIFPPDASTPDERMRVELEDLTDQPDLLGYSFGRPRRARTADGAEAVELRLGSAGTWRQFIPRRRLLDRSVSYEISIERASAAERSARAGPLLLARVAVSAESGEGRWFAEDATRGKPVEDIEKGSNWIRCLVPASTMRLEPLDRVRLLFRSAPAFAEKHGFKAPAADSPPFEREGYLPDWEK